MQFLASCWRMFALKKKVAPWDKKNWWKFSGLAKTKVQKIDCEELCIVQKKKNEL